MKAKGSMIAAAALVAVLALTACGQGTCGTSGPGSAGSVQTAVSANATASASGAAGKQVTAPTEAGVMAAADVAGLEEGAYLVDTRTPEEYAEGHIPGALNASYPRSTGGPCQTEENSASFRNAWAKLGVSQDTHVVVYCRTGVRATAAASALIEDGYASVDVYEGSWVDWTSDPARPVEV